MKTCPNCDKTFTKEELENSDEVYSEENSDPHTEVSYDEYYCADCFDEYKNNTNLLRKMIKGDTDKMDFRLKEVW